MSHQRFHHCSKEPVQEPTTSARELEAINSYAPTNFLNPPEMNMFAFKRNLNISECLEQWPLLQSSRGILGCLGKLFLFGTPQHIRMYSSIP